MSLRYDTISFLSDYGRTDEFVGVVHSVIRQLCPGAAVIDVTHDVRPYDVRGGGLTLGRSVQYLAPGVVMAVVDPGVGSARRSIAVEVGDGSAVLIGPDNGVLAPAVAMVGGATRAVWLNNPEYQLPAPGPLFDGRDVFAPAAAHLCNGVPFAELGELIDTSSLMPGIFPIAELTEDRIAAEVLWVDRYGNVQLNVAPEELDALGGIFELEVDSGTRSARRVHSFDEVGTGAVGLVIDSYGMVAVVARQESAAELLDVGVASPVTIVSLGEDDNRSVTTPVQFGRPTTSNPG